MKRIVYALFVVLSLVLGGCGDGSSSRPSITTQILSDPAFDGDIRQDPQTGAFTITQGNTQSVFAGINPVTGAEYRAFLDFPLTGAGGVPGNAVILSATLDIFIDSIQPQPLFGSIPIRIDLVSFLPPTLVASDFSRTAQPPLASLTVVPAIAQADLGRHVPIDVTPLMQEAQRLGLPDFQVRILQDAGAPGLIEINDTTGANQTALAPLLQVSYF